MELICKHQCTFIWCFYHFDTPFCVILQCPPSKRETLRQKETQHSVKLHDFFFVFYVVWIYILRGSNKQHIICYSSYPIFNLSWFFQCWKEVAKMNTFFHPALDLSHIITSSSISLIILPIEDFFYLIRRLKVTPVFI